MDITFYFFFIFVVLLTIALFFFYHCPLLPQIDIRLMASTLHLLLGRSDSRHAQEEQQRMGWVVGDFGAAQGVWLLLKPKRSLVRGQCLGPIKRIYFWAVL